MGTIIVSVVSFISAFASIYTVKTFGRRTLLLVGQSSISVLLVLIALSMVYDWSQVSLYMICAFIFIFKTTTEPVVWNFVVETVTDTALATDIFTDATLGLILGLTFPTLKAWSFTNTLYIAAAFTILSAVFIYFFVGETKGLSDKEKKEIFMPGATWGRPLKDDEKAVPELGNEHKSRRTIMRES